MRVIITTHAIERYIERVRPGLDHDSAKNDILRLALVGEFSPGPPEWKEAYAMEWKPTRWLIVGDVCFPMVGERAVTCIVKGSLPETMRQERNRARRHERRAASAKRAAKRYGSGTKPQPRDD